MRYVALLLFSSSLLACRQHGDGSDETARRAQFMKDEMTDRGGRGAWEISQQPEVRLGPEWGDAEPGIAGGRFLFAHRWMGQFGSLRLLVGASEDMVLHLRGVVPLNTFRGLSAFHVRSAGVHLDTFYAVLDEEKIEHDVFIDRATIERFRKGNYLYLDIEATSSVVGERGYAGYAFALQGVSWKPVTAVVAPH